LKTYVETGGNVEELSDIVKNAVGTTSLILGGSEDRSRNGGLDCCGSCYNKLIGRIGKEYSINGGSANELAKSSRKEETRGKVNWRTR
jgi:hypothetical protein